jgi:hypothetical protein
MFCTNCGHQNPDTGKFCEACGSPLIAPPVRPSPPPAAVFQAPPAFQPTSSYPANLPAMAASPFPQGTSAYSVQPPKKKSNLALIIILISLALVCFAIAIGIVVILPLMQSRTSASVTIAQSSDTLTGYWSSEDLNEVLKFKSSGKVYLYTADGTEKGTFTFDEDQSEGVITMDGTEYPITLDGDSIVMEDEGTFIRESDDFDPDVFLAEGLSGKETTDFTTGSTVSLGSGNTESVTDKTISISFTFGDRTGTYTGDLVDGVPQGYGSFTTTNPGGYTWTYDGEWVDGHRCGNGATTWDDGSYEAGLYSDDVLNGYAQRSYQGMLYFEGNFVNDLPEGQGTFYNDHGEIIFAGEFTGGFIRETLDERNSRVGAFKDQSIPCTRDDLFAACESGSSVRAQFTGTILQVYDYVEGETYYIGYLLYEQGYTDVDHIVEVCYNLSEGETVFAEGDTVTVWGTTEYNEAYTSVDGTDVTAPNLEAWSVEAYQP